MDSLLHHLIRYSSISIKLKKLAGFVGNPEFICARVQLPHPEVSGLSGESDSLFEFMQRVLLLQQICNVDAGPDVATEISRSVESRHTFVCDPSVFAFLISESVLHDEGFVGIKGFDISFQTSAEIIRMHAFGPPVAPFLFHRSSRELKPRLIEKRAKFVGRGHPDHHWRSVRHCPETFFTLKQGSLASFEIFRDLPSPKQIETQLK